ncbi:MAG: TIGR04084 family radical SAM/SPASM domain-containing protein [Methanoregulaceae archaeon]|nr:TIGR04084 family radical SAM/SPASM domain-containing protein [Methanoregulaceae archaeon]
MHYHVILTDECNLSCRYCRGKTFEDLEPSTIDEIDLSMPSEFVPEPEDLHAFLARDPEDPVVIFYGGEPLLRQDLIRSIIEGSDPRVRYYLYTNGLLLNSLDPRIIERLTLIHVSIDGGEALTDFYRGPGTYKRIIANMKAVDKMGFRGGIIARMTVGEETDIQDAVLHLAENQVFPFHSIHWQLDANFSRDYETRKFRDWVRKRYNPGITELVGTWVSRMRDGEVKRWYPFMETTRDLLNGGTSALRCGAGYANYSIMPDGSIGPCPVMIGMKEYTCGHISYSDPRALRKIEGTDKCRTCDITKFCGGRCLYSQLLEPWPAEGDDLVCESVLHLYRTLKGVVPEVRSLIRSGKIQESELVTERFNGCEIIP